MEENKEINEALSKEQPLQPSPQEQPEATTPAASTAQEPTAPLPLFDLTAAQVPDRGKGGYVRFFAIFGGVFAVCVALLIATLFLGEGGFTVIRELYNERVVYVREDDGTGGLLTPNEVADVIKRSTVTVVSHFSSGSTAVGSGFVYDGDGHICTNHHVIEGADFVQVILPDGNAVDVSVVGSDELADLAVLKAEVTGLVPVNFGASADLLVGDEVVAVGSPVSLELPATATFGNISATRRLVAIYDSAGNVTHKLTLIQTDVSVNPGNSGGPMADMYGRVIGVVVRKYTGNGSVAYEGLGFAIPIDGARVILDAIIRNGYFEGRNPIAEGRSLLGVTGFGVEKGVWYHLDPVSGQVTQSPTAEEGFVHMDATGIYVSSISAQNAMDRVQPGDIIVAIDGLRVSGIQSLISSVNLRYAGEEVTLTVYRGGAEVKIDIRLIEG